MLGRLAGSLEKGKIGKKRYNYSQIRIIENHTEYEI
jgi:hypothetical protein